MTLSAMSTNGSKLVRLLHMWHQAPTPLNSAQWAMCKFSSNLAMIHAFFSCTGRGSEKWPTSFPSKLLKYNPSNSSLKI